MFTDALEIWVDLHQKLEKSLLRLLLRASETVPLPLLVHN